MKNFNCNKLFENMPVALAFNKVLCDENQNPKDFIVLKINQKFKEITGFKEEDVVKQKGTIILNNIIDNPMELIKLCGRVALTGQSKSFEGYSKLRDRWYEVKVFSHKKYYFSIVFNNITERKIKEEKLKEKNIKLNNIFNNSNDIIYSLSWPDLNVKFVSKAVKKIFGYTVEEFKSDADLLKKITHPDDKYIHEKALDYLKKNGFSIREFRIITKQGNIKWLSGKGKLIYDENNKPIRAEGVMREITERKVADNQLKYSEEMYETIFNSAPIGIIIENKKGEIIKVNDSECEMTGYTKDELIGNNVKDIFVLPEHQELADKNIDRLINGEELEFDIKITKKNGEIIYEHMKETNITFPDGSKGILSMHIDINERKKKEKKIRYLSYRDHLTGLYNRRYFEEEMIRLDTQRQLPLSIIMVDINGLKIINDSYGHEKGDQMLIETGNLLKEELREEDILARHGGDEFTILLPKTSYGEAEKIINRLKNKNNKRSREGIIISFSLGFATKQKMDENIKEILKKADDDMYRNKLSESRSNKNKIVQNLINTLDAKSSETKEHAMRMTKLARDLGEKIELINSELNNLALLATLHDIGKTTISEEILTKPGKLTEEEWEIIKEHPIKGYKIASASEEFAVVAEEILCHHEHWNGNGYPNGLKGEEIPYLARIISIIDAYDVMTNERPYSKPISQKEALAEIKKYSGQQFDPKLAKEFINMQLDKLS